MAEAEADGKNKDESTAPHYHQTSRHYPAIPLTERREKERRGGKHRRGREGRKVAAAPLDASEEQEEQGEQEAADMNEGDQHQEEKESESTRDRERHRERERAGGRILTISGVRSISSSSNWEEEEEVGEGRRSIWEEGGMRRVGTWAGVGRGLARGQRECVCLCVEAVPSTSTTHRQRQTHSTTKNK
jgi:hypothetical protein